MTRFSGLSPFELGDSREDDQPRRDACRKGHAQALDRPDFRASARTR